MGVWWATGQCLASGYIYPCRVQVKQILYSLRIKRRRDRGSGSFPFPKYPLLCSTDFPRVHVAGDRRGLGIRQHDLRDGEVRRGERDGGDRLHGLHGHGDAKEQARGEVVERGEDERGAEVEVRRQRQREHNGDVGAQVADRAAQLGPDGRLEADGGEEEPGAAAAALAGEERVGGGGRHE